MSWDDREIYCDAPLASPAPSEPAHDSAAAPDLSQYARFIIMFSGGKDSLACLLHLLDLGIPRQAIELHHHLVDGREGKQLMDWPVTEAYCQAVAEGFNVAMTFSHRIGGFEREMLRDGCATAPVAIPGADDAQYRHLGGDGPAGTRLKFPQVSASLSTRWCSAYLKIDVGARYLANHPKFQQGKTLVVTGERAEESPTRATYQAFEPHRSDLRAGIKQQRHIDAWRPVHLWSEERVWAIIERYRVNPHPAYHLGLGRCSCALCLFSTKEQLATVRNILPEQFTRVAQYERQFGITIHRKESMEQRADAGIPLDVDPFWIDLARRKTFDAPIFVQPWSLPRGAYKRGGGPP